MLSHLSFCCSCLRISCRLLWVCMPIRLQCKRLASDSRAFLERTCPFGPGWMLCGVLTWEPTEGVRCRPQHLYALNADRLYWCRRRQARTLLL